MVPILACFRGIPAGFSWPPPGILHLQPQSADPEPFRLSWWSHVGKCLHQLAQASQARLTGPLSAELADVCGQSLLGLTPYRCV